jgi:hypothetical protein
LDICSKYVEKEILCENIIADGVKKALNATNCRAGPQVHNNGLTSTGNSITVLQILQDLPVTIGNGRFNTPITLNRICSQ